MSSSSSNDGSSTITVTFNVGYPLDIARSTYRTASTRRPRRCRDRQPGGVTIKKQNPNFVLIVN